METNQRVSWEVLVSIDVERVNNYDESITKIRNDSNCENECGTREASEGTNEM